MVAKAVTVHKHREGVTVFCQQWRGVVGNILVAIIKSNGDAERRQGCFTLRLGNGVGQRYHVKAMVMQVLQV